MGWTFSNDPETREQALERIAPLAGYTAKDGRRQLFERHHWTAKGCWGILTEWDPAGMIERRLIAIARIARHGGAGYGEGGLWSETSGPCEDGCPTSLLKVEPIHPADAGAQGLQWAQDFRARVRQEHQAKAAASARRAQLKIGDLVRLPPGCTPPAVTVCAVQSRHINGTAPNGRVYRISSQLLARSTITPAQRPQLAPA